MRAESDLQPLDVVPVRAFSDNYIWMLCSASQAVAVDPGDAAPVKHFLHSRGLELTALVITHHHMDHTGGLKELAADGIPVYGPATEAIEGLTHRLHQDDRIELYGREFAVIEVPGHTAGHIAYYCEQEDILLCGDTLFSAGCGRLFEGTPAQMHESLQKLAQLPEQTRVFCTHEYTLSNLAFAAAAEPGNERVHSYLEEVRTLREKDEISLPSTIGLELAINPFLRTDSREIQRSAAQQVGHETHSPTEVLAAIRQWKDAY